MQVDEQVDPYNIAYKEAELYEPLSRIWTPVAPMAFQRVYHQVSPSHTPRTQAPVFARISAALMLAHHCGGQMATLLDNTVLVIGGHDGRRLGEYRGQQPPPITYASCEIFDPASGSWTATGAMGTPRYQHRATLLPSGRVLAAGGGTDVVAADTTASAEVYDPATRQWSPAQDMPTARAGMEMLTLPSGLVFVGGEAVAGGYGSSLDTLFFNENTNTWTSETDLLIINVYDTLNPTGVLYAH